MNSPATECLATNKTDITYSPENTPRLLIWINVIPAPEGQLTNSRDIQPHYTSTYSIFTMMLKERLALLPPTAIQTSTIFQRTHERLPEIHRRVLKNQISLFLVTTTDSECFLIVFWDFLITNVFLLLYFWGGSGGIFHINLSDW